MAIKPVEILIRVRDETTSMLTGVQAKVTALAVAVAGLFGITLFAGAVKSAAEFEAAMSRVKAAAGATDDQFKLLKQSAEDAGATTKYTSVEAAQALENLAKAGLNAEDSIEALPAVLALAQAGGIELGQAAEFVTKAVMGMGLQFSDAGRVADVLAKGANASNTSVTGLAQALSYAAPLARTLGLSIETTVAIIGKFADAGIDASRAGTALNAIMGQFSDPASKFRKELADAGIITGNFEQALRELAAAGPRGSKAINAVGLEAGPALRALLGQGIGALDELKGKLDNAAGSAAQTAAVMEDNLPGAMNGLASAWDTVRNVLGAPVLPVLKDAVLSFGGTLRGLVSDGTIGKFGEATAEAFRSGAKWAQDFIAQIDFKALVVRLQGFADSAQQVFRDIGDHARIAGGVVQTAYGVMNGGANAVMTAIYGIAASYTEAAIRIVDFAAKASDALAKIAVGDAKKKLIEQAEDMRGVLVGLTGVRDEFINKTLSSLNATADSAQIARNGFASLTGGLTESAAAGDTASAAMEAVAKGLQATAEANAAATAAQQKKTASDEAAKQAAEESRSALATLRAEYAAMVSSGDLQGAAEKLQQINTALAGTPPAATEAGKAAQDAAAQIEAAFERLGVTSSAALKQQAESAQRDYAIIKNAGASTAEDIAASFKIAADKAIAANKGIAPSWVENEAAIRGYRVVTDEAGKSTLALSNAVDKSAGSMRSASSAASANASAVRDMGNAYTDAGAKALAAQGQILAAAAAQKSADTSASSITNRPKSENQFAYTRATIIDYLQQAGLEDKLAEDLAKQFVNADGSVDYIASGAQKRWGGKYSTLSEALGKMVDFYKFNDQGKAEAANRSRFLQGEDSGSTPPERPGTPGKPSGGSAPTYVNNVTINGVGTFGVLRGTTSHTSAESASTEISLLRQLAQAKGASA